MAAPDQTDKGIIQVLSIDDCQATRVVLKEMIERTAPEMAVSMASGYREGLRILAESHFDVILLDLVMPSAPEPSKLVQQVVDIGHAPVIVLSGMEYRVDEIAKHCLLAGACEFFSKKHINRVASIDQDIELLTRVIRKVYYASEGRKRTLERNS